MVERLENSAPVSTFHIQKHFGVVQSFSAPQFLFSRVCLTSCLKSQLVAFLGTLYINMSRDQHERGGYDSFALVRVTSPWTSFRWGK